jgi:glycosyltransferase involved in cell wall biosynthesis
MKFLVAGTCRNISPFWTTVQLSLEKIFQVLDSYDMIIVESNSDDNTLDLLRNWSKEKENIQIISMGNLEGSRTQRIARCRNEYLKYITDHTHLLVVDLDDILNIQNNFREQLYSCFSRDDWDCVACNRLDKYYDIWALRSLELGCNFDCWEMANKYAKNILTSKGFKKIRDRKNYVDKFMIHISQNSRWINCTSAFCGMALYKTSSIKGHMYDGDHTCEHVEFNKGLRIFINPFFISG